MDPFIVSARKYRPATFDTVVGQQSITSTLKNAIKNKQLAQAFLFTGPRGVGKTTCARILAKTINCEQISENIEACNTCESCLSFNRSHSFNVHELDAASNNSVEGIRNLVDQVRIPPQVGKYKVYIIDEVHMLSQQAFNAFLKTLEEPPAYAKFILATTERHKIIPTILSRCQIFDFARIRIEDISKQLQFVADKEGVTAEPNALHIIAQKADGAMRDALSIFDQLVSLSVDSITYKQVIENLNVLDYDYYFRMTDLLLEEDASGVLLLINEIIGKGFEGSDFINGFGEHLRNLLVSQDPATVKLIEVSSDIRQTYLDQAKKCPGEFLLQALEINARADLQYKSSSNKRLMLELALLQIAGLVKKKAHSEPHIKRPGLPKPAKPEPVKPEDVKPESHATEPAKTKHAEQEPVRATMPEPEPAEQEPIGTDLPKSESTEPQPAEQEPTEPQPAEPEPARPDTGTAGVARADAEVPSDNNKKAMDETGAQKPGATANRLPAGISIKINQPTGDPVEDEEEPDDLEGPPSDHFSMQQFLSIWTSLAEHVKGDSQGLFLAMTKYEPEVSKEGVVTVSLDNMVQDGLISERKQELLSHLRKELNNYSIQIRTIIRESTAQQKAYLPKEKFEKMVEKNPEVEHLKKELDLDFDY
jgi:DNA polymerase III subunit gamma/tau